MDPFSISTGIVGFLSFIKDAVEIIGDIRNASGDFRVLVSRFSVLEQSLQSVQNRIDSVKDVGDKVVTGPFGQRISTDGLFQRYSRADEPDGLCEKAVKHLQELFDEDFRRSLRKRDRLFWTWNKGNLQQKVDIAIELVKALRDYLYDDDAQLQQTTYVEVMRLRRISEEKEIVDMLDWISPPVLHVIDADDSDQCYQLQMPNTFVMSSPVYQQWILDAETSYWQLNCFGDPGSGKSHRARAVIKHLSDQFKPDGVPVLFILFNHASERKQSLRAVYRHLLRQILSQRPTENMPGSIRDMWNQGRLDGLDGPSEFQARDALIAELQKCDRSFLVVDALDEAFGCLQSIHSALSTLRKKAKVCIFSTTRLDPIHVYDIDIMCDGCGSYTTDLYWRCKLCTGGLDGNFDLCRECYHQKARRCKDKAHVMHVPDRINNEVIPSAKEIETFVSASLQAELRMDDTANDDERIFSGFVPALTQIFKALGLEWDKIPQRISEAAESNYLVADLIVKRLKAQKNVDGARQLLQGLASGASVKFEDQYDEMFSLCLGKKSKESRKVAYDHLAFMTASFAMLTFEQLSHAIAVQRGDKSLDDFIDRCDSEQTVRKETNGLLSIGDFVNKGEEEVMFFHRTLVEYLTDRADHWFPERHRLMFDACMSYLSLEIFQRPFKTSQELDTVLKSYPFAKYAACFWGQHLRKMLFHSTDDTVRVLEMLNDPHRKQALTQIAIRASEDPNLGNPDFVCDIQTKVSPLHICAFHGLAYLCSILIGDGEDPNCLEGGYGQTALHYASRGGHIETVKVLLSAKANPNIVSTKERTPLMDAIESNRFDVVELLLSHVSINVNACTGGDQSSTALTLAARQGKSGFVKKLLEHKQILINQCDNDGVSALAWAVQCLSVECVDDLLQRTEIDLTTRDHKLGMTPLENIALVDKGPSFQRTEESIVKLFLNREMPLLGGESLTYLIEDQRYHLVKLFLDAQDYSVWKDNHGRCLLHIAATTADLKTLQSIYDKVAGHANFNIDAVDDYGRTALHAACVRFATDQGAATKFLLGLGADPMIRSFSSQVAIDFACQNVAAAERGFVLQTFLPFLPCGINSSNPSPLVALELLAAMGDEKQVQKAIDVEPNPLRLTTDPYTGYTVLHYAMRSRSGPNLNILKMVLPKAFPYLNSVSRMGQTCLHLAVLHQSDDGVKLLLDAGIKLDIKDKWGDTAFDIAQRKKRSQAAFLLIRAGAELCQKKIRKDLIHRAVSANDFEVVRKLVEIGVDVHYRVNGSGLTALGLAKDLYRRAVSDAKNSIMADMSWQTFPDFASLESAAQSNPKAKTLGAIIEVLKTAQGRETSRCPMHKDLTGLIDSLREQGRSRRSEDESLYHALQDGSKTKPPLLNSSTSLRSASRRYKESTSPISGDDKDFLPCSSRTTIRRDSSRLRDIHPMIQGNDRLVLIIVVGLVAVAWMWLLLFYKVQLLSDSRVRNEL